MKNDGVFSSFINIIMKNKKKSRMRQRPAHMHRKMPIENVLGKPALKFYSEKNAIEPEDVNTKQTRLKIVQTLSS